MKKSLFAVVAAVGISLAGIAASNPGQAHHSTAEFDYSKTVTLDGTVRQFLWTNPHSYIRVRVPNSSGELITWNIETGTPAINARWGWTRRSIRPGDRIQMLIAPTRDGRAGGTLRVLRLEDGSELIGVAGTVRSDENGFATFGP